MRALLLQYFPLTLVTLAMCSVCFNFRKCSRLYSDGSFKLLPYALGVSVTRSFSATPTLYRKIYRSQVRFKKRRNVEVKGATLQNEERQNFDMDAFDDDEDEQSAELQHFINRNLYIREFGHQVLIIQPYVKWGPEKKKLTTPLLQINEAIALIKTLRNWKIVDEMLISLNKLSKPRLFGTGQLLDLREKILSNSRITAVFISVNMLKPFQQVYLQELFGVPVYDRYTIVIHIFRNHATTKEAKLQIKLAEMPYLWSRLKSIERGSLAHFCGNTDDMGTVWKGKDFHEQMLKRRESKIKEQIRKLRLHRQNIRENRIKNEIPIVAVVGYTNSGKTSLIKALTGRDKLEPQDYLFATLDVTVHEGNLPSSLKVLYVDTIGFISDIPTSLFESFMVTLEDTSVADVIIHVRDISHPDNVAQNESVKNTLKLLELSEKNMITVGNKVDLLSSEAISSFKDEDMILISARKKIGTDVLRHKIEEYVLRITERKVMIVRVRISGDEYRWLHENTVVLNENPDPENNEYMLVKVIITNIALAKFKHIFINEYYKKR